MSTLHNGTTLELEIKELEKEIARLQTMIIEHALKTSSLADIADPFHELTQSRPERCPSGR